MPRPPLPPSSSTPSRDAPLPSTSDSNPAIQELSRLLLSGWTMLAETCPRPNCAMPLARSRSNQVICTSCGLQGTPQGTPQGAHERSSQAPSHAPSQQIPDTPHDQAHETARATSERETNEPKLEDHRTNGPSTAIVPVRRPPVDAMSAAVGEKLLQGWTMLERMCGECHLPFLRDVNDRVICVGCTGGPSGAQPLSNGAQPLSNERELVRRETQVTERQSPRMIAGRQTSRDVVRAPRGGDLTRETSPRPAPPERTGRPRGVPMMEGSRVRGLEGIGITGRDDMFDAGVDDEVDVGLELWKAELEVARVLRMVRERMVGRRDLDELRGMVSTVDSCARAIRELREARKEALER